MKRHLFTATMMILLIAGTGTAGEDEERIRQSTRLWDEAFDASNAQGLAVLYTHDAMLLPPGGETVKGRDAIERFWSEAMEGVTGDLNIQEIKIQGYLAYVVGTYDVFDGEGKRVEQGKYMEIRVRGDGGWPIHRDIWNASTPKQETAGH